MRCCRNSPAQHVANAHLTWLSNLLLKASNGSYGRDKAIEIKDAARNSIGSINAAKCLELKQTIRLIQTLQKQIEEI